MAGVSRIAGHLLLLAAVVAVVGCDRISKQIAIEELAGEPPRSYLSGVLRLSYAENTGSFLSLGAQLPETVRFGLFVIGVGVILIGLIFYALLHRWSGARLYGLSILVAGGASNWVDRVIDGRVVDFLIVGIGPIRTGVFNIADMAILAGVVILLLSEYSQGRKQENKGAGI